MSSVWESGRKKTNGLTFEVNVKKCDRGSYFSCFFYHNFLGIYWRLPIMCLYVLSSVLSCPFRCSARLYLQLFLGGITSCIYVICICLRTSLLNTYYCVFLFSLSVFVFCTLCCKFLMIYFFIAPSVFSIVYFSLAKFG